MTSKEFNWVSTWASAQQTVEPGNMPPEPGLSFNTLRQVLHVSIGGNKIRVLFSNEYGEKTLYIKSANIAVSDGYDTIKSGTVKELTFSGLSSCMILSGEKTYSDTVDFDLKPLCNITVSIFFGDVPQIITGHPGSRTTSYIDKGNSVTKINLPDSVKTEHWYILSGIDAVSETPGKTIVVIGDSITDGRGSTTDCNNRWPDNLLKRLRENPATTGVALINQGLGGNAVLKGGLGPTALERFDRDVLGIFGIRWLVILEGVNDIGGNDGADNQEVAANLIRAYETFITKAHEKNIRVYGITILPFGGSQYGSEANETARKTVNGWIRTGGIFDAVIDLDAIVRNPNNPEYLNPDCDCGDNLHLSVNGYMKMAEAIDIRLFEE